MGFFEDAESLRRRRNEEQRAREAAAAEQASREAANFDRLYSEARAALEEYRDKARRTKPASEYRLLRGFPNRACTDQFAIGDGCYFVLDIGGTFLLNEGPGYHFKRSSAKGVARVWAKANSGASGSPSLERLLAQLAQSLGSKTTGQPTANDRE